MSHTIEIRWHGRGGQGAKTAALLLADVALKTGMHVQGFPEYGPERMGAPITAYNRISDAPIRVHSNIYTPQYVAVVDTSRPKSEILPHLKGYKGSVYTVDAHKISMATLGKYYPNSPMLAAVVAITKVMEPEAFLREMELSFQHKFAKKPEVIAGNMEALRMTFKEVQ